MSTKQEMLSNFMQLAPELLVKLLHVCAKEKDDKGKQYECVREFVPASRGLGLPASIATGTHVTARPTLSHTHAAPHFAHLANVHGYRVRQSLLRHRSLSPP